MALDLSAVTYTRRIFVGGFDFTGRFDQCSASWSECGGPQAAQLSMTTAGFDETYGIRQGQDVEIRFGDDSATRVWRGVVTEIRTTLYQGLQVAAVGSKLLLLESIPTGIFGTLASTGPPTNLSATTSDADAGVDGIQTDLDIIVLARSIDAEGTTDYTDTTSDSGSPIGYDAGTPYGLVITAGTIAAGKKLDLSWSCGNNATGTEVEVIFDLFGPDQRIEYYDAVGDTLSIDGAFSPTEGTAFSASNTARQATIAGTSIEDVVNYLLDNYLPSELSKGTVDVGALDIDVDLIDLRTAGADLNQILSTLRDYAGDAQWYVDADNAVHFVELGTTVANTFKLRTHAGTLTSVTDVLVGLDKRQLRDGVTVVKVDGEEALDDANLEDDDADWDKTTTPSAIDPDYVDTTRDGRVFAVGLSRANTPAIPVGATKANFIDADYPTLQSWLDDFPNQRALYVKKETLPDAFITRSLSRLRTKLHSPPDAFSPSVASAGVVGNRPRMVPLSSPGVSTIQGAAIVANNFLLRRNPNPVQWTAALEVVKTLYVPGQDYIRVQTALGVQYDLPILSVDYSFDETVSARMTLGDAVIGNDETLTILERAVVKSDLRKQHVTRWQT